jgi:hypothetical protein
MVPGQSINRLQFDAAGPFGPVYRGHRRPEFASADPSAGRKSPTCVGTLRSLNPALDCRVAKGGKADGKGRWTPWKEHDEA